MYDSRPIFFLDEVQLVDRWEKFARRLADQKYQVYITGSNAQDVEQRDSDNAPGYTTYIYKKGISSESK